MISDTKLISASRYQFWYLISASRYQISEAKSIWYLLESKIDHFWADIAWYLISAIWYLISVGDIRGRSNRPGACADIRYQPLTVSTIPWYLPILISVRNQLVRFLISDICPVSILFLISASRYQSTWFHPGRKLSDQISCLPSIRFLWYLISALKMEEISRALSLTYSSWNHATFFYDFWYLISDFWYLPKIKNNGVKEDGDGDGEHHRNYDHPRASVRQPSHSSPEALECSMSTGMMELKMRLQ